VHGASGLAGGPRLGEPGCGWGTYNQNLAVADMNADGFKEVFAPMNGHYITGLDRNGNPLIATDWFKYYKEKILK